MSSYLQQYKRLSAGRDVNTPSMDYDPLRLEHGWRDVASGLARMLVGYFLLLFASAVQIGLLIYLISGAGEALSRVGGNKPDLTVLWITIAGYGFAGIMGFVAYVLILTGTWRCAVNSPERCGARWMIFACVVLLVCGPVISIAIGFSGVGRSAEPPPRIQRQATVQQHVFKPQLVDLIGPTLSLATMVLFVLFLRAIGNCFQSKSLMGFADLYLTFHAMLIAVTGFLVFNMELLESHPMIALAVAGGWGVSILGYLALIVMARITVVNGMANLKSPLLAN